MQSSKKNNISKIKTKATGAKGKPFTLKNDNTYIAGLVNLAKHNGYVKAEGYVKNSKKKVNTKSCPKKQTIKKVTSSNICQKVKDVLLSLF